MSSFIPMFSRIDKIKNESIKKNKQIIKLNIKPTL